MDDRGAEQQVAVQAGVQRAELERHRGDGDGVLEQAAEVGVVAGLGSRRTRAPTRGAPARAAPGADHLDGQRAGREANLLAQRRVARAAAPSSDLSAGVIHLAGEVLEEAFELVAVTVGGGQEARRVGLLAAGALDRAQLDLELVAIALHAPAHAHELAPLEAPGEHVGIAEGAGANRAAAVAQLERQVGGARTGDLALLARAREHGVDLVVVAQRGDALDGLGRRNG